ncbi:BTB/POZ domain-containing adapter for CUL3-mediated RhoA degradation protein 3 [Ciona intestinalis]
MALHEASSITFPANVQSHQVHALVKEGSPGIAQPANNALHQIACASTTQIQANSVLDKNYAAGLSPSKSADTSATSLMNSNKYVKLNVGGSLHYTTMGTLTKEDNMLRAMFSGRMVVLTDSEGWILIDRCGKHFSAILNYLRDGSITLPDNRYEIAELLAEAKYYLIQGLVTQCEASLERKNQDADPICRVPIVTSPKEEQELVRKTSKPIVKFMYNRGNNKYSYTNSSDDNMLKNIELFDKLSLRFNGRILFMKDIIGDEICDWSFYGHQRKVAEICCTSIVYATEIDVEFPEARIYEETLNILLYEQDRPCTPHMIACTDSNTGEPVVQRSVHNCQSDDDIDDSSRSHRVRRIHVHSNRPV